MTKDEILALSSEVVAALWPWMQQIPPPNLTEPANFLRALKLATPFLACLSSDITYGEDTQYVWECSLDVQRCATQHWADTPELALLLALVDYVRRGK